jgi:hypothetical protein
LIKEDGQDLKEVIYEIILKIREKELIPQEWKYGMMCTIHKKGGVVMCDNYTALALLCTTYSIMANMVYVKLVPYAAEVIREYQGGFRSGKSTVDQIFTVRQILENC